MSEVPLFSQATPPLDDVEAGAAGQSVPEAAAAGAAGGGDNRLHERTDGSKNDTDNGSKNGRSPPLSPEGVGGEDVGGGGEEGWEVEEVVAPPATRPPLEPFVEGDSSRASLLAVAGAAAQRAIARLHEEAPRSEGAAKAPRSGKWLGADDDASSLSEPGGGATASDREAAALGAAAQGGNPSQAPHSLMHDSHNLTATARLHEEAPRGKWLGADADAFPLSEQGGGGAVSDRGARSVLEGSGQIEPGPPAMGSLFYPTGAAPSHASRLNEHGGGGTVSDRGARSVLEGSKIREDRALGRAVRVCEFDFRRAALALGLAKTEGAPPAPPALAS